MTDTINPTATDTATDTAPEKKKKKKKVATAATNGHTVNRLPKDMTNRPTYHLCGEHPVSNSTFLLYNFGTIGKARRDFAKIAPGFAAFAVNLRVVKVKSVTL